MLQYLSHFFLHILQLKKRLYIVISSTTYFTYKYEFSAQVYIRDTYKLISIIMEVCDELKWVDFSTKIKAERLRKEFRRVWTLIPIWRKKTTRI